MSIFLLLNLYVGINVVILSIILIKELYFNFSSISVMGTVVYSSVKDYEYDNSEDYPKTISDIIVTLGFTDKLENEVISKAKYRAKKEPMIDEKLPLKFQKSNPNIIKIDQFSHLFYWTIFWIKSTVIALITYGVVICV